jgi:hypothetical protein
MNMTNHHIYKQIIDFEYDDEDTAQQIQKRWSEVCNNELLQLADELFTRLFPGDEIVSINTLSIEAGALNVKQTNREWAEIICRKLEEELLKVAVPLQKELLLPEHGTPVGPGDDGLDALKTYLQTGRFPDWTNLRQEKDYPDQLLTQLLDDKPGELLALIKDTGKTENARKRLAYFFSEKLLDRIIQKLEPENSNQVVKLISSLKSDYKKTELYLSVLTSLLCRTTDDFDFGLLLNEINTNFTAAGKDTRPIQLLLRGIAGSGPDKTGLSQQDLKYLQAIQTAIQKNETGIRFQEPLKTIARDFLLKYHSDQKVDPLIVLSEIISNYSGTKGLKSKDFIKQLYKSIPGKNHKSQDYPLKKSNTKAEAEIQDSFQTPRTEEPSLRSHQKRLNSKDEKCLQSIQKAIQKNIKDVQFQQILNRIARDFFVQLQADGSTDPVLLLQNLMKAFSQSDKIKPGKLIRLLKKSLANVHLRGTGETLNNALYILDKTFKNNPVPETPANDDDYERDTDRLFYYLNNFKWVKPKPAKSHSSYIRQLGLKYPLRLKEAINNFLQQNAIRENLVNEPDKEIVLEIIQLKYPENKTIRYQLKKAGKWLAQIQKLNNPVNLFWLNSLHYAAANQEFITLNYMRYLTDAAARSLNMRPKDFIGGQLKLLSGGNQKNKKLYLVIAVLSILKKQYTLKQNDVMQRPPAVNNKAEDSKANMDKKPVSDDSISEKAASPKEIDPSNESSHFINNAGVVLLWPFIAPFFERLNILKDGKFETMRDKFRAIHALQYLVTGNEEHQEHELAIQKLICGIDINEVYEPQQPLNKENKEMAESLLLHVIKTWTIIGHTSVEGLRESFLQRNGKLTLNEEAIYLQVEQKSYDMLLDRLPWSIAIINFSWMAKPINVIWR